MIKINIITYNNNYGLTNDFNILKSSLIDILGDSISINFVNFFDYKIPEADINIFLEIVSNILINPKSINILIPNQEWFYRNWLPYLNKLDYIWCKTKYISTIFKDYVDKSSKIEHIGWCSRDMYLSNINKNYQYYLHLCGKSIYKQSQKIIDIWDENMPQLVIIYSPKDVKLTTKKIKNIKYITERVEDPDLAKLMNYCGVHICCSETEGFGHYIQEAKSCESIVITTDAPPMNTFVSTKFGFLVKTAQEIICDEVVSSRFIIEPSSLINTINTIIKTPKKILKNMGKLARESYFKNNKDFKSELNYLTKKMVKEVDIKKTSEKTPISKDINLDLPTITIITPTANRRRFFKLSLLNFYNIQYDKKKIEWIIVEDGDESIEDLIPKDDRIKYYRLSEKKSIGYKRNYCIEKSKNDIIVCMDDDDYYPPLSVISRITYLLNDKNIDCVTCTTIGCFHINKYISMINVPPHQLPFEKRISEASLVFRKSFWEERKFNDLSICSEATDFLINRSNKCQEISWDGILVSLLHGNNTSDKITVTEKPNGCHFGFSDELFLFITNLDTTLDKSEELTKNK